jgi:hypothetical protein
MRQRLMRRQRWKPADDVAAEPELVDTPSESSLGQLIARCPKCCVAVWSNYAGAGPVVRFVRIGTLEWQACQGRQPRPASR